MAFYVDRFKNMETREFEVEVVTPLFLGGANTGKAELRVPSIKGALRFWWRALYGSDDLKDMKERESAIFGSTIQKASFSLQLKVMEQVKPVLGQLPQGLKVPTKSKGRTFPVSIIEYLAYGLCEYDRTKKRNMYIREHIPPGTRFTMVLDMKDQSAKNQILDSLALLAQYGGLGSHSRNGFGCIKIKGLSGTLKNEGEPKSFSALSSRSVLFDKFKPGNKWEIALSEIGRAYREARTSLEKRHRFAKRQLIAKPLIVKGEVNINARHSKPYFLHVNKIEDDKYQGHILFVPYQYYDPLKRKEYVATCQRMNQKLTELSGGAQ
jgi:CRISPR-associated protein Cmr1